MIGEQTIGKQRINKDAYRAAIAALFWMLGSILGTGGGASAQSTNRSVEGTGGVQRSFRIAGTAVNARTGELLARARISLSEVSDRGRTITVITGDDGHFEFTGLPAAKYSLAGVKRGFLAAAYEQHEEQYSTAIVTGTDFATEELELKLMPMAVISGHVYDEFGEGIRRAQLILYHEDRSGGTTRTGRADFASSDDRGYYDFSMLRPGTYYIAVKAKPWYASHGAPQSTGDESSAHISAGIDVAYPTTFYGGATESDSATPIALLGGEQLQMDIRVSPVRAVHLTFHIPLHNGEENFAYNPAPSQVQKRVFDSLEGVPMDTVGSAGIVELSLPPGRYTVITMDPKSGQLRRTEDMALERNGQELDDSRSQPLARFTVTLKMLGGEPLPGNYALILFGAKQRMAGGAQGEATGKATFVDVMPGTYAMRMVAGAKRHAVTRISSGAGDSIGHDVTVATGDAQELTVSVATGNVTIEGAVQKNGKPVAGVMVALIPKDPEKHIELFRRDQSDFDGAFHVAGVIPGTYTLAAVEDAWGFEWLQPGVLARYVQHGQELTVGELMRGAVHLPEPVEVQPR
jgi:protocatechuate 3,4-dioxygenase beta subunit